MEIIMNEHGFSISEDAARRNRRTYINSVAHFGNVFDTVIYDCPENRAYYSIMDEYCKYYGNIQNQETGELEFDPEFFSLDNIKSVMDGRHKIEGMRNKIKNYFKIITTIHEADTGSEHTEIKDLIGEIVYSAKFERGIPVSGDIPFSILGFRLIGGMILAKLINLDTKKIGYCCIGEPREMGTESLKTIMNGVKSKDDLDITLTIGDIFRSLSVFFRFKPLSELLTQDYIDYAVTEIEKRNQDKMEYYSVW